MLSFVGLGINGCYGIGLDALEILRQCDIIYLERFTNFIADTDIQNLEHIIDSQHNRKINIVNRWFVEDAKEILYQSKEKNVALITYGDPFMATTINELYVRARKNTIKTKIIHGISGISSLVGETGLHNYKFGRTTTIMSDPQSAISVYNTIHENLKVGNHTLILTEYSNTDTNNYFFLSPIIALRLLLDVERDIKYNILSDETFVIIASRIGMANQKILAGNIKSFEQSDFGHGPHSIIVTGQLHFTEIDSITSLYPNLDPPLDNTRSFQHIAEIMLNKYLPKAKEALKTMRSVVNNEMESSEESHPNNLALLQVLENAEYYLLDAERFLNQHKFELAILSIGYAEGLIDSLRFQKNINPWLS